MNKKLSYDEAKVISKNNDNILFVPNNMEDLSELCTELLKSELKGYIRKTFNPRLELEIMNENDKDEKLYIEVRMSVFNKEFKTQGDIKIKKDKLFSNKRLTFSVICKTNSSAYGWLEYEVNSFNELILEKTLINSKDKNGEVAYEKLDQEILKETLLKHINDNKIVEDEKLIKLTIEECNKKYEKLLERIRDLKSMHDSEMNRMEDFKNTKDSKKIMKKLDKFLR